MSKGPRLRLACLEFDMSNSPIRQFVQNLLTERGRHDELKDTDAIFTSGLLDSMAATEVMLYLESEHGIDLADADFDISALDTLADLEGLLAARAA